MKYQVLLTFDIERLLDKRELRSFIKEALEHWGGQRHPDDWLFDSLDKVQLGKIERKWGDS